MIAVVSPSRTSTSGRARAGMKPCTKALYVSLISRCDSAATVPNTNELLPEPETPVNTVSRRFGISRLTSLRLFTRAPCTRISSWLSATCSAGDCASVLVAMLIVSPSVGRSRLRGLRRRLLARSELLALRLVLLRFGPWSLIDVVGEPMLGVATTLSAGAGGRHLSVLKQPEDVAIGVGDD